MKREIITLLATAVLFCSCTESSAVPADSTTLYVIEPAAEATSAAVPQTEAAEPSTSYTTVSFTALGDNLIHSALYNQAARRYAAENGGEGYDFSYAYEGVAELIGKSDVTVLNQETLICNDLYEPSNYPRFNSPTALGDYMRELGVDVFTIANNHTLDKGADGLSACLDYYDENDMIRVGVYRDSEDRADIRTVEVNGVTVSFLCYTEMLNGLSLPENSDMEIGMTSDKELMLEEIRAADEISDICIVSLHWGTENSSLTEDYQRSTAALLAEAGADVIIGNHPHVLREIEIIDNADGSQTLCAYSLGNFISAQAVGKNLIGGILDFSITVSSDENEPPKLSDVGIIPIVTHYDWGYSNIRLYTLDDYTPELALAHGVRAYSEFDYDLINDYLKQQGLDKYIKSADLR